MDLVRIQPSRLSGTVEIPPSKSAAHRAILCAAMAEGRSEIFPVSDSQDMDATIRGIRALGAQAEKQGNRLVVDGSGLFSAVNPEVDCGESGSTLRFLIPIAAAGGVSARFVGQGRLPRRPLGIYKSLLPEKGTACQSEGGLPLTLSGRMHGGLFELPGDVSSQFITGLLLALPLALEDSEIRLTTPLESAGYVEMTLEMQRRFGITISATDQGWKIPGGQAYQPQTVQVEGDWSQAAFFLSAGALGGEVALRGLNCSSLQGDRQAVELFSRFGAKIWWEKETLFCKAGSLHGIRVDAGQIPDLVPALAVTAAFCTGETRIENAARLRIKESDRLAAAADGLRRWGVPVEEQPDSLRIQGGGALRPAAVRGYNDHRIVMAFSIAAAFLQGESTIDDAQSIAKSYPDFFNDYHHLGGIAHVIHMGK